MTATVQTVTEVGVGTDNELPRWDPGARRARRAAAALTLAFAAVATAHAQNTPALRIAMPTDMCPLASVPTEASAPVGLLPAFWRLWSRHARTEVRFLPFPSEVAAADAVVRGEADLLIAASLTMADDARLIASRPFARMVQAVVGPDADLAAADLAGQRLRFERADQTQAVEVLVRAFGLDAADLVPERTLTDTFTSDPAPLFSPSIRVALERIRSEGLHNELHVFPLVERLVSTAASADRPDLLLRFESGLERITSGELASLEHPAPEVRLPDFFLEPRDRFHLTRAQRAWLRDHPVVRLGASEWPPLTLVEDGVYTGIGVETVRQLLARIGVRLQVVGSRRWDAAVDAARRGDIDGLGYTMIVHQDANLAYTQPMLQAPLVIVSRADSPFLSGLEDLRGLEVLVPRGYPIADTLQRDASLGLRIRETASARRSIIRLAAGEGDALIELRPIVRRWIRQEDIHNLQVTAILPTYSPELRTAIRADWPELVALLDQAIATADREDAAQILARFERPPQPLDRGFALRLAAPLLLIIAALVTTLTLRRRKTARLLKESEALLRRAQRISKSGSWSFDRRTGRVHLSAESYRIFGWQRGLVEIAFDTYLDFYDTASRGRLSDALAEPAADTGAPMLRSLELVSAAEPTRHHRCVIESVDPYRSVGTITDITDAEEERQLRKSLESQVNELERLDALGRLAGGIAHDFNNILTVSLAHAEFAQSELPPGHPARLSVDEFAKASLRARDLVRQIQVFGRHGMDEQQQLDICTQVRGVASLLSASLPPTIRIETDLPDDPLWVRGAPTQLDLCWSTWASTPATPCPAAAPCGSRRASGACGHRWRRSPAPWCRATTSRSWSPTPARAWRPMRWPGSSSPTSRHVLRERAPASACRWSAAWCRTITAP